MEYYVRTGKFAEGVERTKEIEEGFSKYSRGDQRLLDTERLILYYLLAYCQFGVGDFKKALYWMNNILSARITLREDVLCSARIFNLIIHYEIDNRDLLEYQVRSTYRFLYKRNRLYKFENIMLEFIRKRLPYLYTRLEIKAAFIELRNELYEISKNPFEAKVLFHFDIISWLDSKINESSLAEVVVKGV